MFGNPTGEVPSGSVELAEEFVCGIEVAAEQVGYSFAAGLAFDVEIGVSGR
jgi:hypothetical protein